MKIREIQTEDQEKFAKFFRSFFGEKAEFQLPEEGFETQWLQKPFSEMFRETGGNFWILVDTDENILGSIGVFKVTESFAEIKRFFLDKSLRGTGCANDLWNLA